ncbi:hypothetical protein F7R01_02870 [Pseudomonas argentinensis]|uniref:hypothetical protein n=1 Tax=Phytopseudomonas argentinensis TaxID=289370 RepID=UPI000AE6A72A|nr:hypothetical protein [Pseudomonas argentinensis]KAB0550168.1 hypothetical protein F7R01_02870 [Pseudomonas argentinensis]
MNRLMGSALLLAALFSAGAQADGDGQTLQQQRDRIGDEMVRERTGSPPASDSATGQSTTQPQQPADQQAPRSTLNSPARQNDATQPAAPQRQPATTTPGTGTGNGSTPPSGASGGTPARATEGTGDSQGTSSGGAMGN